MPGPRMAVLGMLAALTVAAASAPTPATDPGEASGDVLALYPSFLTWDAREGAWRGEIRGKIYRSEHDMSARLARTALRTALGVFADRTEEEEGIFRVRAEEFAVDAERGKRALIEVGGRSIASRRSEANGHFLVEIRLPLEKSTGAVPFRARLDGSEAPYVPGTLRLVGPEGVSVISDVDDTVKETNVLDRGELVANTFFRPYRPVPGMPALYAGWGRQGAAVHYVTASPWQLFTSISAFLAENGFPVTQIVMRDLRLANASFVDIFRDSQDYKKRSIREILRRFPARRFVFVGDSGEHDPEVYAAVAREYPERVQGIFIRAVLPGHLDRSRYRAVFEGIEESKWLVFDDPATLPGDLAGWPRPRAGESQR